MIAKNFLKYAEAMALQFPLPFGQALVWALSRPTTRLLREHRAARARSLQSGGRIRRQVSCTAPQWWKNMRARARALSLAVKGAMRCLNFEARPRIAPMGEWGYFRGRRTNPVSAGKTKFSLNDGVPCRDPLVHFFPIADDFWLP